MFKRLGARGTFPGHGKDILGASDLDTMPTPKTASTRNQKRVSCWTQLCKQSEPKMIPTRIPNLLQNGTLATVASHDRSLATPAGAGQGGAGVPTDYQACAVPTWQV